MLSAVTTETPTEEAARGPLRRLLVRLAFGHAIAYPMAFISALASMPWSIVAQADAIENTGLRIRPEGAVERWLVDRIALTIPDAAAFRLVMGPVTTLMIAVFVICHVAAWRWGRRADVTTKAFTTGIALSAAALVAFGVVGWVWIFLAG
jgi:cytochrome bd-type quinol oxidase subunit 1